MDFRRRLLGLQEAMEKTDLDLVVYGSCQNFQYLTGLLIDWRRGRDLGSRADNVFVPRKGTPIITLSEDSAEHSTRSWIEDVRVLVRGGSYEDFVSKVVSDIDLTGIRVGLGDHVWASTALDVAKAIKGVRFEGAETMMNHLRMIKDTEEIERLRRVAELTDRVMEAVVPNVKEGAKQPELGLEVEFEGRKLGASDVSFPPAALFVKAGSEVSTNPFTYPKKKGLEPGTSIAFDFGFVMDGYSSDFGRSFYYGPTSGEARRGYEALHQGVLETADKIHDGSMRVCDLFPALERTLDRLGFGDYLRARLTTGNLGHNIGVEVHEPPWLSPEYNQPLRTNMVLALEPKIWHKGEYYLRVEDIVLVGHRKAEFLTCFDREIFQL